MCVCVCVCEYVCMCVCVCACVCARTCAGTHTYVCVCVCVRLSDCVVSFIRMVSTIINFTPKLFYHYYLHDNLSYKCTCVFQQSILQSVFLITLRSLLFGVCPFKLSHTHTHTHIHKQTKYVCVNVFAHTYTHTHTHTQSHAST